MQKALIITIALLAGALIQAQSIELMPGNQRFFADLQWLKSFDQEYRFSLFSRTRITVDYENQASLFSGAYLNYTGKPGIGATLVGTVGGGGAGAAAGAHVFKSKPDWMLFGLAAVGIKSEPDYSWFSIFRYTPKVGEKWKLYASLELYTLFNGNGHVFSVERLRIGLDKQGYQFGLASNHNQSGSDFLPLNNYGPFFRKSF